MPRQPKERSLKLWITAMALGESFLWLIAVVTVSAAVFLVGEATYFQSHGSQELEELLNQKSQAPVGADGAPTHQSQTPPAEGSLVGRIEIPKAGLSAVIFEGTTDQTLSRGVGHLSTSPWPGQPGNVALAAHRDTFFRPLRKIRNGDEIWLITPDDISRYQVTSTEVVDPGRTEVLKSAPGRDLTLITCYPFGYFGNAPERFIVHGRLTLADSVPQTVGFRGGKETSSPPFSFSPRGNVQSAKD